MTALRDAPELLARLRGVHREIRDGVVAACEAQSIEELGRVVGDDAGDTQFAIDRVSESLLVQHFAPLAEEWPCLLIAAGWGTTAAPSCRGGGTSGTSRSSSSSIPSTARAAS